MIETATFLPTVLLFYTDPGSGALIMQLIFASLVGALFYLRKFVGKLRSVFVRTNVPVESVNPGNEAGEQQ